MSVEEFLSSPEVTVHPKEHKKTGVIEISKEDTHLALIEGLSGPRYKKPKKTDSPSKVNKLKAELEDKKRKAEEDDGSDSGNATKKARKLDLGDDAPEGSSMSELDAYERYGKLKADDLKDILRWNDQKLAGKKETLVLKVMDCAMHGRLSRCNDCGGKVELKTMDEKGEQLEEPYVHYCKGNFNEDVQAFVQCGLTFKNPTRLPFISKKPSDEESETISAENKAAYEAGQGKFSQEKGGKLTSNINFDDLDLSTMGDKKEASSRLLQACRDSNIKLPADDSEARPLVGKLFLQNPGATPNELLNLCAADFGIAKTVEQETAVGDNYAASCKVAENGPIYGCLSQLASFYYKEGNANAGNTYKKAMKAISELEYLITSENALGLGKNKTKVKDIGKGTAEKMKEFMDTGKIQKLEEKKAAALSH